MKPSDKARPDPQTSPMSFVVGVSPEAIGMSRLCDGLQAQAFLPDRKSLRALLDSHEDPFVLILPANQPTLIYFASRHPQVHRLVSYFSPNFHLPKWKAALTRASFAIVDQTLVWSKQDFSAAVKAGADPDRIRSCSEVGPKDILDERPRRAVKEALASLVLDGMEMAGGLRILENLSPDQGTNVVNYHRVLPPKEHQRYTRPQQAIAAPLFEVQVEQMAKNRGFIDVNELRNKTAAGRVGITFDDGYEDNHRVALDTLSRWSVPACIYVVTQQIDSKKSLWWDYVGDALFLLWEQKSPELNDKRLPPSSSELLAINSVLMARDHISHILGELNSSSAEQRSQYVSALKEITRFEGRTTMLSWEQVQDMQEAGIRFGSHTQNHVCLDELSASQAQQEVFGGQSDLEQKLGQSAQKSVALPRGKLGPFTEKSLKEAGFSSVMTTIAGVNRPNDDSLFVLRRDGKMLSLRGRHHPAKLRLELTGWMDRLRNLRSSRLS